ncbi:class I SAM-dependent methyltransferase [Actinospica sp. MGRD01-02]|uniref:Class I SAM-dependent methyltransferase n=1 Tax=Actinospica acidithermotolerans TaxID=2828514 RepID=A0A941E9M2_9ACTN|nr:cyclopropane-fatty-acyl-phospholipid synthase family protein [Actinospica acidithermotolerans]MBR7825084.1 class I SAM-dependent methyltransferase [Actinospica acidithermotolerans]
MAIHVDTRAAAAASRDVGRWPDVFTEPRARLRGAVAARVVRSAVRDLPVRLRLLDGTVLGAGSAGDPEMTVHRPQALYRRIGASGLIGFGESYQAGEWDSDDLARLLAVFAAHIETLVPAPLQSLRRLHVVRRPRTENQTSNDARDNISRHYDLSNEMFALFLDPTMTYSSALFDRDSAQSPQQRAAAPRHELALQEMHDGAPGVEQLRVAQQRKIDRLLDLTGVGPGTDVLEIGSGWGELAVRAATRGARVHTITLSERQLAFTRERAQAEGVADRVQARLCDYRDTEGRFDAVLSVEMIEAVGREHWPTYFGALAGFLNPGGRIGLQAITMPHARMNATARTQTWITKYIFPGGLIPSMTAIKDNAARVGLRVADDLSFGRHYAHTLALWSRRFEANAGGLGALGFDETFRRTWRLYLAYSEAGFASGYLDVHQLVLCPSASADQD